MSLKSGVEAMIRKAICQHEPANFSNAIDGNMTFYPNQTEHPTLGITIAIHLCRLCGVFYTDIDAIRAGEEKYEEAQETK